MGADGRIAVVGGGITGLAAAYHLERQAEEAGLGIEVALFEASPRCGGKLVSERAGGFLVEGSADSFITRKPQALELAHELGLGDAVLPTNDDRSRLYVLRRDRLVEMPRGMLLVVPTELRPFLRSPLLSWPGRLRALADLVVPRRRSRGDESLARFVTRRLGREALETVGEPLMAGIHTADPEQLSLLATFPRFAELERNHGSLIRALRALRSHGGIRSQSSARVSLTGGVEDLARALAAKLVPGTLRAGSAVEAVEPAAGPGGGFEVSAAGRPAFRAEAVVLATPAHAAAAALAGSFPVLARDLGAMAAAGTAIVSLGFRVEDVRRPLDGFGFVVPRRERRRLRACTFSSTKFDGRAPEGNVLLRGFVGGPGAVPLAEQDDEELIAGALEDLDAALGLAGAPVLARVHRWERGTPRYDVGHLERVAALEARCPPGLLLAGSAFHGIGLPDCVRSGREAAERALAAIAAGTASRPVSEAAALEPVAGSAI